MWSAKRQVATIARAQKLRLIGGGPFDVTWTANDWQDRHQSSSLGTSLGVSYVDIVVPPDAARLRFTVGDGPGEYAVAVTG